MSPRTFAALALAGLTLAPASRADANRLAFLDAPPPTPAPKGPPPARESDEYARKNWEASPELALGAPFCRGDAFGPGRCAESGGGTVLGGSLLYRLTPYVALGANVSFASFRIGPEAGALAYSRADFIGFSVRGYFADRGAIDPYVEAGLGRGSSTTGWVEDGVDVRTDGSGPSAMAGAGIDFWVAPFLKLGPTIAYRWTWLTDVRACAGAQCETWRVADRGAVGSYANVGFSVTLALGREM